MKQVQTPDGVIHAFPDDATDAEIDAILNAGKPRGTAPAVGPRKQTLAQPRQLPEFLDLIPQPMQYAKAGPDLDAARNLASALVPFADFSVPLKPADVPGKLSLTAREADTLKNIAAIAQDEQQLTDVIQKTLPGAKFVKDADGNTIVEVQGRRAYLNRPGASPQDLVTGTTAATVGLLAATPAGAVARLPLRAAATGSLTGVASAAQDLGAHLMGAEEVVDPARTALATGLGAAAQYGLDKAVASAYRLVAGRKGLFDETTGKLTEKGIEILRRAGATAEEISDDLAKAFAQEARTAANPGEALRYAEAKTLPVPVQPTRGQLTLSEKHLRTEQLMREGAMGESPSGTMRAAQQTQQEALRGNVPAIQTRISGAPPIEPGQGGQGAQAALRAQHRGDKTAADTMFDAARAADAQAPSDVLRTMADDLYAGVRADHSLRGLPRTTQLLDELDEITTQGGADDVAIRALFEWRTRASNAARGAAGGEEGVALRKTIATFDEWMPELLDKGLVAGDEAAIGLWKSAIDNYRRFAGKFKGGDLIQALVAKEPRAGAMQLKVAPEDAANYIFGASATGWISKANLTRDLRRMRDLLGAGSAAWKGLRQEAFLRFARHGEGATDIGGERLFSGVKFKKAWTDALQKNPEIMHILFEDRDRALISQFANVAARVTATPRYSTAGSMSVLLQNVGGRLGERVATFLKEFPVFAKPVGRALSAASAKARANARPARGGDGARWPTYATGAGTGYLSPNNLDMRGYADGGRVRPIFMATDKPAGLLAPGNIDLTARPKAKNADGSISTVRSMSFDVDGREVLVPTISDDGRIMSDDEAFAAYVRTGRHLGIFESPDTATAYAKMLHDQQGALHNPADGYARGGRVRGNGSKAKPVQLESEAGLGRGSRHTARNPSPAQIEAGNYRKRHLKWRGLEISIETEAGGVRRSKPGAAAKWETRMYHPYGYIVGSKGADGDALDVFVGPKPQLPKVFVIDQADPKTRTFDECKAVIGVRSPAAAAALYDGAFSDGSGPERRAAITEMTVKDFKQWLRRGPAKRLVAAGVNPAVGRARGPWGSGIPAGRSSAAG